MANVTIISVPSQDATYRIPNLWDEAQIRANYSNEIPGLANMTCATTDAAGADGTVRTLTFTQRTGQKG